MGFARELAPYDKRGCKLLVQAAKEVLFKDKSCRMTKKRCEAFFEDENNFGSFREGPCLLSL